MSDSERAGQLAALLNALHGAWPALQPELGRMRAQLVEDLIVANCEERRGRVKMIDEMLRLPNTLRQEMNLLAQSIPE